MATKEEGIRLEFRIPEDLPATHFLRGWSQDTGTAPSTLARSLLISALNQLARQSEEGSEERYAAYQQLPRSRPMIARESTSRDQMKEQDTSFDLSIEDMIARAGDE